MYVGIVLHLDGTIYTFLLTGVPFLSVLATNFFNVIWSETVAFMLKLKCCWFSPYFVETFELGQNVQVFLQVVSL